MNSFGFKSQEQSSIDDSINSILNRRHERFVKPIEDWKNKTGESAFPAESLSAWISIADESGIDFIPAMVAYQLPVASVLRFEDQTEEDRDHWNAVFSEIERMQPDEMMRLDFASGSDLKTVATGWACKMSDLMQPHPLNQNIPMFRASISPGDPRIYELSYEYASEHIPVLIRPWVKAREHDEAPVEYRVFVRNGEITGIANYYYHRDLPDDEQTEHEVINIIRSAQKLIESAQTRKAIPYRQAHEIKPDYFEPGKIHCTMDFLVDEDGTVKFLEAGPAFGAGAHPCAFVEHRNIEPVGLALSAMQPAKDLSPYIKKAQEVRIKPASRT